jgi:hypothetical protein
MALRPPSYLRHKTGQAFVKIAGRNVHLGVYGSAESKERYRQAIAELWDPQPKEVPDWPTVEALMARYIAFAEKYYQASNELEHILYALRPLRRLYGELDVHRFKPMMLGRRRDRGSRRGCVVNV